MSVVLMIEQHFGLINWPIFDFFLWLERYWRIWAAQYLYFWGR